MAYHFVFLDQIDSNTGFVYHYNYRYRLTAQKLWIVILLIKSYCCHSNNINNNNNNIQFFSLSLILYQKQQHKHQQQKLQQKWIGFQNQKSLITILNLQQQKQQQQQQQQQHWLWKPKEQFAFLVTETTRITVRRHKQSEQQQKQQPKSRFVLRYNQYILQHQLSRTSVTSPTTTIVEQQQNDINVDIKNDCCNNQEVQENNNYQLIPTNDINNNNNNNNNKRKPSLQITNGQRPARRLNQGFKYLYRGNYHIWNKNCTSTYTESGVVAEESLVVSSTENDNDDNDNSKIVTNFFITIVGYTLEQVNIFQKLYPSIFELNVTEQLYPKYKFLRYTLCENNSTLFNNLITNNLIPIQLYYGQKLEKILASRHAFLQWQNLPCTQQLMTFCNSNSNSSTTANSSVVLSGSSLSSSSSVLLFHEFLQECTSSKRFAILCQRWKHQYQKQFQQQHLNKLPLSSSASIPSIITPKHIEAFEILFTKGILSCVRNELIQNNNTWTRSILSEDILSNQQLLYLLLYHGASIYEYDYRGSSLLHWAAGCGNIHAVQILSPHYLNPTIHSLRDNSTPLHWSAAGTTGREFGTGGHLSICQYLIEQVQVQQQHQEQQTCLSNRTSIENVNNTLVAQYINACTYDGNTASMWAAWSGSYDVIQYLIEQYISTNPINGLQHIQYQTNTNGCSISHWAASSGNVNICQYLYNKLNVLFNNTNNVGNTPLSHAIAFGHVNIVSWLLSSTNQYKNNNESTGNSSPNANTKLSTTTSSSSATLLLSNHHHVEDNIETNNIDTIKDSTATIRPTITAKELANKFVRWTNGNDENRIEILQLLEDQWG